MPGHGATADVLPALRALLGDRLSTSADVRRHHGSDEGAHAPVPPDAVAFPRSTDEVAAIVRICGASRVPIIPFGAGTSFEGGVAALHGGLCLDLSGLDRILAVHEDDLDCTVEAGVTRVRLNDHLGKRGFFFPIDLGADATVGGMASTRASGINAVRYGTMRDVVTAVKAVLANGEVVRTARRVRKSSAGYDLTRLLVGAEGTLGVITEVTVRIRGIPEATGAAICGFTDLDGAVDAAIEIQQWGIPVARIELLDELQIEASNAYSGLGLPVRPILLMEFHGTERSVAEQAEQVAEIAGRHGGSDWEWATDHTERNRLWKARHEAFLADRAQRPGVRAISTDVCVPLSRLAECIRETRRDLEDSGLHAAIHGHVGDGNFHAPLLFDPDDPAEEAACRAAHDRMVRRALEMGGTCTGEHGVGHGKVGYLEQEHGPGALRMMRAIKQALDPDNIMNPGKVVDI